MRAFSVSLVLGLSTLLTGCADIGAGRPLVIQKDGSTNYPKLGESGQYAGLYKSLYIAEQAVLPKEGAGAPTPQQLAAFREAGFDLVQQSCQFYISAKTRQQRGVNTWRDSFGPVTALVTGAIPLIGTGGTVDKNVVQALSLATTAANSAFDIYEQRFLFGAKNVEGIRNLVLEALNAHAQASVKMDKTEPLTYGKAILRITEHQIICSPSAISELVTASINAATPVSKAAATGSSNLKTTVVENPVVATVAVPPTAVTPAVQASAQ